MTDEYDVFTEAEVEDRLLRRSNRKLIEAIEKAQSYAPVEPFILEVGTRAALHSQRLQRDMRWFRGLFGMRIG